MDLRDRDVVEPLHESFSQCVAGKGQVVIVTGGLASGKTELLQKCSEMFTQSGALHLSATGARAEQDNWMGIIWQLLHSAPLPGSIMERLDRLLGGGVPDSVRADSAHHDSGKCPAAAGAAGHPEVHVMHGVSALLLALAQDRPLVITVDDVHFADEASLETLLYLRRRMRSARILLVFTEWARPDLLRPVFRTEVTRYPYRRITLELLCVGAIERALTEAGADPATAARHAPAYHALTGGNPMLVNAVLEDRWTAGAASGDPGAPVAGAAYRQAVLDCLQRWDPHLFDVARALVILEENATPAFIARLLRMRVDDVERLLDVLTKAGLLVDGAPGHPEIAATLHALSDQETAHLHTQTAELLYERGADETEIARHLVRAGTVQRLWGRPLLCRAARQALVGNDPDLAVSCLELALRESDDESERLHFQALLAQVGWWVNPSAAARYFTPLQEALAESRLPRQDALPVIRQMLWNGSSGATAQLERMTAQSESGDVRELSELWLAHDWIYGLTRGQGGRTAGHTAEHRTSAMPASLFALLAKGATDDLVGAAEHILQGRLATMLPEAGATVILLLDHAGQQKRAVHWCDFLEAEAARQGATTWRAVLGGVAADMALRRGNLAVAESRADRALGLLHVQSWGVLVGFPLATKISAATAMGHHEQAAELLDQVVPDAMLGTTFGLRYLQARGHHHLAMGRPFAALGDFEHCAALMRKWRLDFPALVPWRSDLAQAHLALGRRKKALELLTEQLERLGSRGDERARGLTLRLLALVSPLERRAELLGEAIELLERSEDHLELARALADRSQVHHDLGELGDARLLARRAAQEAKACNAETLSALQLRRASQGPQPEPAPAEAPAPEAATTLSEAERKVATLAAYGHSNREIGRKLFITVSTVEQHLTRVYRKLNVQKREDLPLELAGRQTREHPAGHTLRSA
ncbi:LuxR C-terminal-related transcriptional regulator [Streptomyces sp. NPDC056503]|uniref:LuxR C-terminal-related transcriptional regulator n=1 Tax=Streptomyces sp. NPDC056503 TaxID=3345842 RepID=UPI0036BE1FEC